MSLRDAYQQRAQAQMEEMKARMDILKARAKRIMADGKIMGYEELANTEQKMDRAKTQLKQMATATGEAAKELKDGVEKAIADLGESLKRASARFENKE